MNEYAPTAFDMALSIYTNAVIDMKHELNKARRDRLQRRANYALRVAASVDNPFPGWKLPERPTSEPCARCYGSSVIAWRGCLYPCPECCKIDGLS